MKAGIGLIKYLLLSAGILFLWGCSGGGSDNIPTWPWGKDSTGISSEKPRYIWIDACANFPEYADSRSNIERDLKKVKSAGFTDIVVDVRPVTGDVLYKTDYAPLVTKLDYWDGSVYKYYERTSSWDYLQAFIDEGHELGLKVDVSFNTFVGGVLYCPYGELAGQSQGMLFRDASAKGHATVLNLSSGLINVMDLDSSSDPDYDHSVRFLNPADDRVQTYILNLLGDLAKYDVDGIFLDRCRYESLLGDFSDVSKEKFEEYTGCKIKKFPEDILSPGTSSIPAVQPEYFKKWLEFRAKVIHDFIAGASEKIKSVNRNIKFGVYVGGWYSTYYEVGVNWAAPTYDTSYYYPEWATADYKNYGFADHLDFLLLGAYAGSDSVYGTGEWTMQGFCSCARRELNGAVEFAGGPDVGNASGFESGGCFSEVEKSVDACINASDGYFIFDISHVRKYGYWNALKNGIDNYLQTLNK
ncbi:MAG: family 10 glycosylhydrolase [Bacteroidales bacterium]|jgi:uncharacterized lipoprotein YddW (UPF0748 family)|nr:family 10 glycosylhydrolase [Bacteroidales bacterium]